MNHLRGLTVRDVLALDTFEGGLAPGFAFSPDGSQLAFVVQRASSKGVRYMRDFLMGNDRGELWVIDLTSRRCRSLAAEVGQGRGFYAPAWSPDGRRLAAAAIDDATIHPVVIDLQSGERTWPLARNLAVSFRACPFHWLTSDRLLCAVMPEGRLPVVADTETRGPRRAMRAWPQAWKGRESSAHILDAVPDAAQEPPPLDSEPTLLTVDLRNGSVTPFGDGDAAPGVAAFLRSLERPPADKPRPLPPEVFPDWAEAVPRPENGRLVATHAGSGQVAHLVEDNGGSRLLLTSPTTSPGRAIFETNLHLGEIRPGTIRDLHDATVEGAPLRARLLLPPDYRLGEQRPAVAWVYPGQRPGPGVEAHLRLNHAGQFNLQFLAARGYVVIVPAMPLSDDDASPDLLPQVASPVAAAVEAAVAEGIVDPARVHVLGQSLGGWAVMVLLATTSLFRSGISMAGVSNPAGLYGGADPRFRYGDPAGTAFIGPVLLKNSFGIDTPPWLDPERYRRESPLSLVERIHAPLLITQGDQDYVPITQGEEMFAALRYLNRRVRFVRYWGEGHVISSPANIEHLWEQIFAWMEEVSPENG